jgi:hypothetical protein
MSSRCHIAQRSRDPDATPARVVHTTLMNADTAPGRHRLAAVLAVLILVLAATASTLLPLAAVAADPSPEPAAAGSPDVALPGDTSLCQSADNLRLIIDFLGETSISEDGVIPVVVGVIAGLSEVQALAGLLNETYRPLVDDLTGSLETLRTTVETIDELGTLGAQVAAIGEAVTAVGSAMDALSVELQSPCAAGGEAPPGASLEPAG